MKRKINLSNNHYFSFFYIHNGTKDFEDKTSEYAKRESKKMLITEAKKHFILCVQWQNSMHYHANDKTLTSIAPSVEFVSTPPLWCWRYFHPWPIAFRQTSSFIILHHSCLASLPLMSTTPFVESAPYVACFFFFFGCWQFDCGGGRALEEIEKKMCRGKERETCSGERKSQPYKSFWD